MRAASRGCFSSIPYPKLFCKLLRPRQTWQPQHPPHKRKCACMRKSLNTTAAKMRSPTYPAHVRRFLLVLHHQSERCLLYLTLHHRQQTPILRIEVLHKTKQDRRSKTGKGKQQSKEWHNWKPSSVKASLTSTCIPFPIVSAPSSYATAAPPLLYNTWYSYIIISSSDIAC